MIFPTIVLTPSEVPGASLCLTTLSRYYNVRASAKRYEERYDRKFLESTRVALASQPLTRSATTDLLHQVRAPPNSGCLLLWRNLYNKGSSIQGLALRARREMHWHREAVRWGFP